MEEKKDKETFLLKIHIGAHDHPVVKNAFSEPVETVAPAQISHWNILSFCVSYEFEGLSCTRVDVFGTGYNWWESQCATKPWLSWHVLFSTNSWEEQVLPVEVVTTYWGRISPWCQEAPLFRHVPISLAVWGLQETYFWFIFLFSKSSHIAILGTLWLCANEWINRMVMI